MSELNFVSRFQKPLSEFTRMSVDAGKCSDYIQGGGGNTSCKLDERQMAIKASGFQLSQITPEQAYAVVDYQKLRDFYQKTDPKTLEEVEKDGSAVAKAATREIEGLKALRPSVEAGFHAILDTFVLHSHAVYANLLTCSVEGPQLAGQVMATIQRNFAFVPYINPGAQLTFAIQSARQAAAIDGVQPNIIFLQNHGVIVTGPTAQYCLDLHDEVNDAIAFFYGVSKQDWPNPDIDHASICVGEDNSTAYKSATPWLKKALLEQPWTLDDLTINALYPDQLVFLAGQVAVAESGDLAQFVIAGPASKATIFKKTGEVLYLCGETEARTIEETLTAVLFIHRTIRSKQLNIGTMSEAGKSFIANWESEAYRKSVAAK